MRTGDWRLSSGLQSAPVFVAASSPAEGDAPLCLRGQKISEGVMVHPATLVGMPSLSVLILF